MARTSLNKNIFTGNLGKDPIVMEGEKGPMARLSLGLSDYKGRTSWANLVAYGKQAELARDYLKKGDGIAVVARYQTREYESNGQKQYAHEFIIEELNFLGGNRGEANGNGHAARATEHQEYDPEEALGFNSEAPTQTTRPTPNTRARKAQAAGDDLPF